MAGIFTRDENDSSGDHGQKVSKTAHISDFFVRNDKENTEELEKALDRFLEIIFGVTIHTPNADESGMFTAMAAAQRSACLSRQVGAAIFSSDGELLGIGWNDVPRAGGGLYGDQDKSSDHRCFKWRGGFCHNDSNKNALYEKIFERLDNDLFSELQKSDNLKVEIKSEQVEKAIRETPVRSLIEYSRSIHAEMEAILSVARSGKVGLPGSKLYTTTYPCHSCARHIVASGISEVFYVEPYSKSLALELHGDAISLQREEGKVAFLQYEGVGPRVAMKLFQAHEERKDGGKARLLSKKTAVPVLPPPIDGFTTHEKKVTEKLKKLEDHQK